MRAECPTLLVLLECTPIDPTIVLGLHKIQISTYNLAIEHEQFEDLHWYTGQVKDHLIWLVPLDVLLIILWAVIQASKTNQAGPRPDLPDCIRDLMKRKFS